MLLHDERDAGNSPDEPADRQRPPCSAAPSTDDGASAPCPDERAACASSHGEESNEEISDEFVGDPFADPPPPPPSVTARITNLKIEAGRLRRFLADNSEGTDTEKVRLAQLECEIAELSKPQQISVQSGVVVRPASDQIAGLPSGLTDTLKNPTHIAADAFATRAKLATEAGVLEMGLDLAQTIGASNSFERIFADELAACHGLGMHFVKRAKEARMDVTAARFAKAAMNAMAGSRAAAETILRIQGHQPDRTVQNASAQEGTKTVKAGNNERRKIRGDCKRRGKTSKLHASATGKGEQQ